MTAKRAGVLLVAASALFLSFILGYHFGQQSKNMTISVSDAPAASAVQTSAAAAVPAEKTPDTQQAPESAERKININTATAKELESLPGIGPVIAQRIVDYRAAHGAFSAVRQLTAVNGIGSKKLTALQDYATVE